MLKKILIVLGSVFVLWSVFIIGKISLPESIKEFFAATFFVQSITVDDLKSKFLEAPQTGRKVKILIVPGHEPNYGGAEYGALKERDMNVDLALRLAEHFKSNSHFDISLTRDKNIWNPELESYFKNNWQAIIDFSKLKKSEMEKLVLDGRLAKVNGVAHPVVSSDVATRLYGINKWASENDVDLLVHIHFNDYPRARADRPGKYWGFTIYVPEQQYSNSLATREVAKHVLDELSKGFTISNFPKEESGIVESPDLIATGNANTVDGASLLIEYGYIYRPVFQDEEQSEKFMEEMAERTYLGLVDFFQTAK